ncbi:phage tail protein [Magnetofaba australis]|uniref:Putative P2 GpU family protein n=1 Tax=Magnetofaba australis IT-1 TaxID=1434232 RepID=A0A1Y2K0S7_9PROT|nr:phage tail protein [Magnetofaba australis]OSM01650.1 putative P2 GpU family protein [Magnetofaba australis IT-1]
MPQQNAHNAYMTLGDFDFSLSTAAPASLKHSAAYRWPSHERPGQRAVRQFTGPGDERITLDGVIYPQESKHGLEQLPRMRRMAEAGKALQLVSSCGAVHGRWIILNVQETRSYFLDNGAARKIEFSLELSRYHDDKG